MDITVCDRCKDRSKTASSRAVFTLGLFTIDVEAHGSLEGPDDGGRTQWADLCIDCAREIVRDGEVSE